MESKTLTSKKLKELMAKSVDKIDWGWITYYLFEKVESLEEYSRKNFNKIGMCLTKIESLESEVKNYKELIFDIQKKLKQLEAKPK